MNKFIYIFVFVALTAVSMVTQANVSVSFQPRIVGGQEATAGSFPFMGSLQYFSQRKCAVTFIGGNRVLTAAHCVDGKYAFNLEVKFGGHDLSKDNEWDSYWVKKIIVHEDYNENTLDNDLALLELEKPVTGITPVVLADDVIRNSLYGKDLLAIGWGAKEDGMGSDKLREVVLPYVGPYTCGDIHGSSLTDSMLCAGYLDNTPKQTCVGDSGGPLLAEFNNRWIQVGVTSWGPKPCDFALPYPSIFTDVAHASEWIESKGFSVSELILTDSNYDLWRLNNSTQKLSSLFLDSRKVTIELSNSGWFDISLLPTGSDVAHGSTYTIRSSARPDHYVKYNIGEQNKQMVQTVSNGDSFTLTFNAVTKRWSASSNSLAKITTNKEIRCLNPDDKRYPPEVCRDKSIPNLQDLLTEFDNVYIVMTDGNWTKRIRTPEYYYGESVGEGVNYKRVYIRVMSSWSAWFNTRKIGPSVGDTRKWFRRVPIKRPVCWWCP